MASTDVDIASAGNGGVATAAANGGAISTGNINSGGNVGNAISVGDTTCYPVYEDVKADVDDKAHKDVTAVGVKLSPCRIPALVSAMPRRSSR